jgi:hypothetical protein
MTAKQVAAWQYLYHFLTWPCTSNTVFHSWAMHCQAIAMNATCCTSGGRLLLLLLPLVVVVVAATLWNTVATRADATAASCVLISPAQQAHRIKSECMHMKG